MNADFVLYVIAAFAGFLLKTGLCFVAMSLIVRLVRSASSRFALWMAYLTGTALYWMRVLMQVLGQSPDRTILHWSGSATSSATAGSSTALSWVVPQSWALYGSSGLRLLAYFYVAVVGIALMMRLRRHLRLRRMLAFARTPDVTLSRLCDSMARSLSIGSYRLLVLPGLPSPATVGWLNPTVLLPAPCEAQDFAQLSDVIQHELYHIKRRDYLIERIAHALRVLLFFHPAAWLVCSRLGLEREMACDQAVVRNHPEHRADYAECLVRFARLSSSDDGQIFGMEFAAKSNHLHARIRQILAMPQGVSWWQRSLRAGCSAAVLVGVGLLLPSLTIALGYAHPDLQTPLIPIQKEAKATISRRTKHVSSMPPRGQRLATLGSDQVQAEVIPLPIVRTETSARSHDVLTPPADTVDENPASSSPASDQAEIALPSRNPPQGRVGVARPTTQSVTSTVIRAATQLGRLGHGGHDKNFR